MSALSEQAEKAAARVDVTAVGFDPITIITIITQVLPLLIQCFNRNDEPTIDETSASIRRYHSQHPEALRRRTARRVRADADERMTKSESFAIAAAIIAQAVDADSDAVVGCCREAL